ncbi:MAG: FMN-binding protein [Candidatus Falkowbacteria bacterium]
MKNNLKKIILSLFVIGAFIFYAIYRQGNFTPQTNDKNTANNNTPSSNTGNKTNVIYKDGEYTGASFDALYGVLQVKAVVQGGKLTDVIFLSGTQEGGRPLRGLDTLKSEAITAQSANVDTVSGATNSSGAFVSSLASALAQATK